MAQKKTQTVKSKTTKNITQKKISETKNKPQAKQTKQTSSNPTRPIKPAKPVKDVKPAKESKADKHVENKTTVESTKNNQPAKTVKQTKPSQQVATADIFTKKDKWIYSLITFFMCCVLTIVPIVISLSLAFPKNVFAIQTPSTAFVGYSAEYLGSYKRTPPTEVKDEGLETGYPKYGYTLRQKDSNGNPTNLDLTVEQKTALIYESNFLCATPTKNASGTYDMMDEYGNLYRDGNPLGRKLYKHTSAVGNYLGDVSDDEPAVVKKVTMGKRSGSGYAVTGLYAPAGEVIKIEISEEDMNATGGIVVHIGQALYNGQANNIWSAKGINRMPVILNTMYITKNTATLKDGVYTGYIGSFLGGPIYICDENVTFSATISGAVNYSHFILGYTTKAEFEQNKNSSAPFFDLEVWENGVLHSGPKYYAQNFSYEDLYKAAVLWEKISLVSTQVANQGIVFLYDTFVAAGGAVAFPGRRSVNCPMGWLGSALNYDAFVNSGSWGNMHEYNHNFQSGWGMGNGGEVTNNALSLVSYSLFTKISSNRKLGVSGEGMSGWNKYTSASWSLSQILGSPENGLSAYASVLHNFGQEKFMETIRRQRAGGYGRLQSGYYRALTEATHNNMDYFFKGILGINLDSQHTDRFKDLDYPMFVPVATTYQTGRSFIYDGKKEYITTMQPYHIKYGEDFQIDLRKYGSYTDEHGYNVTGGSLIIPNGFTYKIKNMTQPQFGNIRKTEENIYIYSPDRGHLDSGKIYVTLEITKDDDSFEVDDIDLVLEFVQDHEMNKTTLTRTTYTYTPEKMQVYTNSEDLNDSEEKINAATLAYDAGYAGYTSKVIEDNNNMINGRLVQNANAEIWNLDGADSNTIMELSGKVYVSTDGDYRISLRGRQHAALYVSTDDGANYVKAAVLDRAANANAFFESENEEHYYEIRNRRAGQWVYFKAILVVDYSRSFVGVGWGRWEATLGTAVEGEQENGDGAFEVDPDDPGGEWKISYASAYRSSYDFPLKDFQTEYFYSKTYTYNHSENVETKQSLVSTNYKSWMENGQEKHPIDFLFDEDESNFIHSDRYNITESNPFELVVNLNQTITANSMTIFGASSNNYKPKNFKLYLGSTPDNLQLVKTVTNSVFSNNNCIIEFDTCTFQYYKLVVTDTHSTGYYKYISFRAIKFGYSLSGGNWVSPDNKMFTYKGNWEVGTPFCNFGHIYAGSNVSMEFEFTGTNFAILSYLDGSFADFEVLIDNNKYQCRSVDRSKNASGLTFLSPTLQDKKHKVVIRSKAYFNIDSIVLWK